MCFSEHEFWVSWSEVVKECGQSCGLEPNFEHILEELL